MVQVQRRLRDAAGARSPITDMFRFPTIRSLAAHLGEAHALRQRGRMTALSRAQRTPAHEVALRGLQPTVLAARWD